MLAGVSDFVLIVVPVDVEWQPDPEAGQRAADLVVSMTLTAGDGGWHEVQWHEEIALVDCGENLQRIGCPNCHSEIDVQWWGDLMEERFTTGQRFVERSLSAPCCSADTALDLLEYDWPMAFARFEIAIWNPTKVFATGDGLLTADQAQAVEEALGHPIRQVRAHY